MGLIYGFLFAFTYPDLEKVSEGSTCEVIKTVGFFLMGVFYSMNKFSITSVMLFMSLAIDERIKGQFTTKSQ